MKLLAFLLLMVVAFVVVMVAICRSPRCYWSFYNDPGLR